MSTTDQCDVCLAILPPSQFAAHVTRYHRPQASQACRTCPYRSHSLTDTITHCLLEGHNMSIPEQMELAILPASFSASFVAGHSIVEQLTGSEPGWEWKAEGEEAQDEKVTEVDTEAEIVVSDLLTSRDCQSPEAAMMDAQVEKQIDFTTANPKPSSQAPIERGHTETEERVETPDAKQDSSLAKVSSHRKFTAEKKLILQCKKCGSEIKTASFHLNWSAVMHVRSCHSIRPFACSACLFLSSRKNSILQHIKRKCPGAEIETVDKDKNEEATRVGMLQCFPSVQYSSACL